MTTRVWNIGRFALTLLIVVTSSAAGCGESNDGGTAGSGGTAGGAGTSGIAGAGGVGGGTPCVETDCDDGNPCTENLCDPANGTCSNPTFMDGTTCSADENPGRCVAGVCTGLCEFVDCDDGNECTEDRCDPAHGSCFNPPVSDGTVCDAQGDPGRCSSGLCLGLCADVDCDDGKGCTEDLCDTADGSCEHPNRPDGADCDFAGLPGRCESGACVDAELCREVDCSDGNDCTEDVCDPTNANCSNPNKVDGSFCETGENPGLCVAGRCQGLCEGVSCEDGNQCTVNICDPSNASCPNPDKTDGTPCDYGDDPGRCSAGLCVGLCTGVVCNDHNQCTSDACDPSTGSCTHTDRAEGTSCDFGGVAGVCEAGQCVKEQSWGTPVLIETSDLSAGFHPAVAVDPNGDVTAVWSQTSGISSNRYTSGGGWGTAVTIGGDNTFDDNDTLDVAVDANGNATAVWGQSSGLWSNRYTPSGGWGTAVLISSGTNWRYWPRVVVDSAGNATAVWIQGDPSDVWANRYTPGVGWGTAERIETGAGGVHEPNVAVDTNGNVTAAWAQSDGVVSNAWANRYTPGVGWGTPVLLDTEDRASGGSPQVAADFTGNVMAAWAKYDGSRYNLWADRYTPGGGWGTAAIIQANTASPLLAVDPDGNAIAVWASSGIWAKRYTPSGGWGIAERIETNSVWSLYDVTLDSDGKATVVWTRQDRTKDVWSNRYTPSGGWGTPVLIESDETGDAFGPQIAVDPTGRVTAVWSQRDPGGWNWLNIWANRFE